MARPGLRSQSVRTTPETPAAKRTTIRGKVLPASEASPAEQPSPSLPTHLFETQEAWASWLEEHHKEPTGLWLKLGKKNSSIPAISYDTALDTALAYGWIDGQRKPHCEDHFLQKFTPRRKQSLWSKRNVDKVAVLVAAGSMRPSGQAEVDAAKADGRWARAYAGASGIEVPNDFQTALDKNSKAKRFFDALNKTQRFPFLFRIETTRRPETRKRKIGQFVDMLAEHKTL